MRHRWFGPGRGQVSTLWLDSPSRLAVVTKQVSSSRLDHSRIRSQGNVSSSSTLNDVTHPECAQRTLLNNFRAYSGHLCAVSTNQADTGNHKLLTAHKLAPLLIFYTILKYLIYLIQHKYGAKCGLTRVCWCSRSLPEISIIFMKATAHYEWRLPKKRIL